MGAVSGGHRRSKAPGWNTWWVRSLLCGAFATLCDYVVVIATSTLFALAPSACTSLGLLVGASIGFILNRGVAFKDVGPVVPAALRYVGCFGVLMILHAGAVAVLAGTWSIPLVIAKACADVVLLAGGQLLLLRYIVFPRNKGAVAVVLQPSQPPARAES